MNASARNAYLDQSIATATPGRLLVMLYDRLVLDVQRAIEAQNGSDHAAAGQHLLHAQEIVLELMSSLRPEVWEGAEKLSSLYGWLYSRLVLANTSRDVAITTECLGVVEPLAETWREAALVAAAG